MRTWIIGALLLGAIVTLSAPTFAATAKQANGRISFWGDRDPVRPSIYAVSPNGTRVRDFGRGMHSANRVDWSPNGRLIAFEGRDYVTLFDFDIFVAPCRRSRRRKITSGPERDLMPSWSPTAACSRSPASTPRWACRRSGSSVWTARGRA